ncbi:MAG: DUF2382 domain-containing protein [Thermomicrobiales bacterium]
MDSGNNYQSGLSEGMDVVGSDGDKVGDITEISSDHFVVKKGFFFPHDYYIPTSAIASVDGNKVYLNMTKDEAMNQDPSWAQRPATTASTTSTGTTAYVDDTAETASSDTSGYAGNTAVGPAGDTTVGTQNRDGDLNSDPAPFEHEQDSPRTHLNENDDILVPLAEEELTATTRSVDRGSVNVEKNVVAEERTLDVPVMEEEVHVRRRTVDRPVAANEDAFPEDTIEVPVHGEEVAVQKRARVVEELEIDKQAVQGTKRVTDTVRREEVVVDDLQTDTVNTASGHDEVLLDRARDTIQDKRNSRDSGH